MTRRVRLRIVASVSALGVATLLLASSPPDRTEAEWTDAEHATSNLHALELSPPQIAAQVVCSPRTSTGIVVNWEWAAEHSPYPLSSSDVEWRIGDSVVTPTTSASNGEYTTTFTSSLLERLLGSLITTLVGGEFTIDARTTWTTPGDKAWQSGTVSDIHVDIPGLLEPGSTTCTVTNGT